MCGSRGRRQYFPASRPTSSIASQFSRARSPISGQPNGGWLEVHSVPIDTYTTRPLVLDNHLAVAPDAPGTGVTFDWEKLAAAHLG